MKQLQSPLPPSCQPASHFVSLRLCPLIQVLQPLSTHVSGVTDCPLKSRSPESSFYPSQFIVLSPKAAGWPDKLRSVCMQQKVLNRFSKSPDSRAATDMETRTFPRPGKGVSADSFPPPPRPLLTHLLRPGRALWVRRGRSWPDSTRMPGSSRRTWTAGSVWCWTSWPTTSPRSNSRTTSISWKWSRRSSSSSASWTTRSSWARSKSSVCWRVSPRISSPRRGPWLCPQTSRARPLLPRAALGAAFSRR